VVSALFDIIIIGKLKIGVKCWNKAQKERFQMKLPEQEGKTGTRFTGVYPASQGKSAFT
jgi:hypothetical protein